jgi:hypothetical protein
MTALLNGKPFCVSKAEYGTSYEVATTPSNQTTAGAQPAGGMKGMGGMHEHSRRETPTNSTTEKKALTTISKMSDCVTTYPVKQGDKIKLVAHYDLNAHPLYVLSRV